MKIHKISTIAVHKINLVELKAFLKGCGFIGSRIDHIPTALENMYTPHTNDEDQDKSLLESVEPKNQNKTVY